MAARIIGVGQQWAGDDGVGLAVIRRLRTTPSPLPHSAKPSNISICGPLARKRVEYWREPFW